MRTLLLLMSTVAVLMAADTAVIVNSGSTNAAGFRIEVNPSGDAMYTLQPRRAGQQSEEAAKPITRHVPSELLKRFFANLDAGKPLSSLPSAKCMKSASFGTRLYVSYKGETSPDMSCGNQQDSRTIALAQSAREIITLFSAR